MQKAEFEKYLGGLSLELQEKARQCKDAEELNRLLAENDVELSEDALEMVAGGCSKSDADMSQGDIVSLKCTECGSNLRYWDMTSTNGNRYYCANGACVACQEHWLFRQGKANGMYSTDEVKRIK